MYICTYIIVMKGIFGDDVKKVVVLSGTYHKVGDPSIPQAVVQQLPLFVEGHFLWLESPDSEK